MTPNDGKYVRLRVLLVAIGFSLFFVVIGWKAAYLQIYRGPLLSQMAAEQYEQLLETSGKRGTIYDRNRTEMAVSVPMTSIAAYPGRIADKTRAAADLAKALGLSRRRLLGSLNTGKPFVWVKRQATPREVQRTKDLNLDGIGFVPEYSRVYPHKTLAAQVIGFTGIDGRGLEGIEYAYDNYIRGSEGRMTLLRDALGHRFLPPGEDLSDISGNNLILTLDRTIQYITEKALSEAVTETTAQSGIAVVMVPATGAVLAMAPHPQFNPNAFLKFDRQLWRNRAITDPLEPGSTIKIFSAAAAIESGGSSPNTIFFCENGAYRIGSKVVHDAGSYGWLSLQQIIKYSSNIGAIKISEMIGAERLYGTLRDFGFGSKTGIDCPGETVGSLSHYTLWTKIDAGTIAFGHGIAVSPIQLITAVSAIANRGALMRPRLVEALTDQNGRMVHRFEAHKVRQVISVQTAKTVSRIMQTVVAKGGTGTRAALQGYSVCGKTGTAQKLSDDGTYSEDRFIASFVGFTPADNPAIAVLVIIDEPQGKYHGGSVAAPVFRQIAQETLNYLNVPADYHDNQLAEKGGKEGPV
jgi:cell division protein FtsI (penicillin-binding protein 3)